MKFRRIVAALLRRARHCSPVIVTYIEDAATLRKIVDITNVRIIQLHYSIDDSELTRLSGTLNTSFSSPISFIRVISASNVPKQKIRPLKRVNIEACIVDSSWRGGTGAQAKPSEIRRAQASIVGIPLYISGGLDAQNVRAVISKYNPVGVDVQSRVEIRSRHRPKDGHKVRNFAEQVDPKNGMGFKCPDYPCVCLAVTEAASAYTSRLWKRFSAVDIDRVHFDFSDKSIATAFASNTLSLASQLRTAIPSLRYDVHFFLRPELCEAYLEQFLNLNPLLRLVTFFVSGPSAVTAKLVEAADLITVRYRVALGFSLHAPNFTQHSLRSTISRLSEASFAEISLITHSQNHPISTCIRHDKPLLDLLVGLNNEINSREFQVSIDRDVTIEKLSALKTPGIRSATIGKALIAARRPQIYVNRVRALLGLCEQRVDN